MPLSIVTRGRGPGAIRESVRAIINHPAMNPLRHPTVIAYPIRFYIS
jgi:hypothetical protein